MKLAPIIDWLAAGNLGLKRIDGIESLAALDGLPNAAFPAAFVVQGEEARREVQNGPGLIVVEVEAVFQVVTIITTSAARGLARDELTGLSDAIIARLLGYTPDPDVYRPITPGAGRLLGLENGRASWIDSFRTVYRLRKQG